MAVLGYDGSDGLDVYGGFEDGIGEETKIENSEI